jgi:hypothetical protein
MSGTRAPALRPRVTNLLALAALEPEGLAPAAVLIVRTLRDPLPGRLAPHTASVRPPAEWERAVRRALAARSSTAARPVAGVVPESADTVLFADQAELLAAFARDAAAGVSGRRWWWAALLRGLPGGEIARLVALWTREARHVPAALEHLSSWREAERVLVSFQAPQVTRILAAVAHAFELSALLAVSPASLPPAPTVEGLRRAASAARGRHSPAPYVSGYSDERDVVANSGRPPPPWEHVLPPALVPGTLGPEHRALLGLSLVLHRAPLVARSTGFVARFARWRASTDAASAPPAAPAFSAPAHHGGTEFAGPLAGADRAMTPAGAEGSPGDARAGGPGAGPAPKRAENPVLPDPRGPETEPREDGGGREQPSDSGRASPGYGPDAAAPLRSPPDLDAWRVRVFTPPAAGARAASGACGVFLLVNALRSLHFFRLLDEHFRLPPAIGGWGWVELVARALLGARGAGLADDAVWRLLAGLDGRDPEEHPGAGFAAPATERLPDPWIDLFRGAPPPPRPSPPLGLRVSAELQRFLDLAVPVIRARIETALYAAGADPAEPLETTLLRRVGIVETTSTHVDVHMEMDQVTLPVRLAGLDANPGWVPELARVVTFHFA